MPFKSEKQRRYLFANEPEVAKKFAKDYNMGGVASMFRKRLADGDDPFYDAWKKVYETNPDAASMNEKHDEYLEKYTLEMSTQTSEAPTEDVEQTADPMLNLFSETDALNNDQALTTLFAKEEPQGIMAAKGGRIGFRGGGQDAGAGSGFGGDTSSNNNDNTGDGGWENTQSYEDFNKTERADPDALDMQDYLTDYVTVNEKKQKEFDEANTPDNFKQKIKIQKDIKYKENINNIIKNINNQLDVKLANKAINYVIDKVAMSVPVVGIAYGLAKAFGLVTAPTVSTDISGNIIGKNTVTPSELGFYQGPEYDDFWQGGPDKDDGGSNAPIVDLITGEVNEDVATGKIDLMSALDKIRANQAKRSGLVANEIIQDNNQIMTANKGGLAGLFKVKTQ